MYQRDRARLSQRPPKRDVPQRPECVCVSTFPSDGWSAPRPLTVSPCLRHSPSDSYAAASPRARLPFASQAGRFASSQLPQVGTPYRPWPSCALLHPRLFCDHVLGQPRRVFVAPQNSRCDEETLAELRLFHPGPLRSMRGPGRGQVTLRSREASHRGRSVSIVNQPIRYSPCYGCRCGQHT